MTALTIFDCQSQHAWPGLNPAFFLTLKSVTWFTYMLNKLWHYNTHAHSNHNRRRPDSQLLRTGPGPDFHPDSLWILKNV